MILSITLLLGLLITAHAYSMEHVSDAILYNHKKISKQGSHLLYTEINQTTAAKWSSLFEQAQLFYQENPTFSYRRLTRSSGQGPDAQGIVNAAPLVISCLQQGDVTEEQLKKFRFTLGMPYISKLMEYKNSN